MNGKRIGDHAEHIACQFLQTHGLELVSRNYRCRRGEIDLIMRDGDSVVFVEVRYRKHSNYGRAAETVSPSKQARIIYCARHFLSRQRTWNQPARFDVVCIDGEQEKARIEWLHDAFRPPA